MNGFRFNKSGWELGLGPIFRLTKVAEGYWDENDKWNLAIDMPEGASYDIVNGIDNTLAASRSESNFCMTHPLESSCWTAFQFLLGTLFLFCAFPAGVTHRRLL